MEIPKDYEFKLWTQKFGCKEILDHEQLYNTIEYIENNRIKHELPINKGLQPLVATILCDIDHAFRTEYKGGFDVIIGNPPYVQTQLSNIEKTLYAENFQTIEGKPDLYRIFIEKSIGLMNNEGLMSFITPNSFLTIPSAKKLRNFIREKTFIQNVVTFQGNVFQDASINTVIFVLSKSRLNGKISFIYDTSLTPSASSLATAIREKVVKDYEDIKNLDKIEIIANDKVSVIIEKMNNAKDRLADVANYTIGLQVYHNTMHSKEDISNRIYHSEFQKDETYIPELGGKNISRYSVLFPIKEFVSFGEWCYNKPDEIYLTGKRIFIREIPSKSHLICSLYEGRGICSKAVIVIKARNEEFSEELLAILNSRLMGFYLNNTTEKGTQNLFPRISLTSIKKLPLKISSDNLLSEKSKKMLSLNTELQNKRQRFLKRLSDNLTATTNKGLQPLAVNITKALETFYELDFAQFLAELKKQKITLTLKQQDEWEEYFNEYKTECKQLSAQITETDNTIDQLVYALYGLTEEEIKIVEG
ncbi:MAG: Eco57I restriction-modification methylase domain-containing protein [Lentimicrobiaceae bacterium]|nr:Eco57I restriction-modification methylase domain-containing protein [Lentimicrobiaceae bacterium]